MHRLMVVPVAMTFAVSQAGCFTVKVTAPKGARVELSDAAPDSDVGRSKRHFFLVSGLVPLGDNTTSDLIPSDCSRVAVKTQMSVVDGLITVGAGVVLSLLWGVAATSARLEPTAASAGGGLLNVLLVPHSRTTYALCTETAATPSGQLPAPAPAERFAADTPLAAESPSH